MATKDDPGLKAFSGSASAALGERLLENVIGSLFLPASIDPKTRDKIIDGAMATVLEIAPRDGLEGILATQMTATHTAAMECLRRAATENQSFEGRNAALQHAQKLLRLYLEQMKMLDAYRGKTGGRVMIEQVNVAAGGQAIVGSIDVHAAPTGKSAQKLPGVIEHQNATPFTIEHEKTRIKMKAPAKAKHAKRKR